MTFCWILATFTKDVENSFVPLVCYLSSTLCRTTECDDNCHASWSDPTSFILCEFDLCCVRDILPSTLLPVVFNLHRQLLCACRQHTYTDWTNTSCHWHWESHLYCHWFLGQQWYCHHWNCCNRQVFCQIFMKLMLYSGQHNRNRTELCWHWVAQQQHLHHGWLKWNDCWHWL